MPTNTGNNKIKLLVVEDEAAIRDLIRFSLDETQFNMQEADSTNAARKQLKTQLADIILLDWMLPGQSGIDFIHWLKQQQAYQQIPIILLTAKAEENSKIRGLDSGADDYITKPFSPKELIARIKTILRRGTLKLPNDDIHYHKLCLKTQTQQLLIEDQMIVLSAIEYKLLHFLLSHPNRIYSRNQLIDHVWGSQTYIDERSVDVQIRRLRVKLKPHYHQLIKTVRGSGYQWQPDL